MIGDGIDSSVDWDINFDIGVDPQCTVLEAHAIASQVEEEIKRRLENILPK